MVAEPETFVVPASLYPGSGSDEAQVRLNSISPGTDSMDLTLVNHGINIST